ncbi:MAG TPA: hypothetical protein VKH41_05270 [Myxococcota bacterium]|nr:hypothetical protein [Myxococcota bacterium]
MTESQHLAVRRGLVRVVSAFDVGLSIDLARAKQQLADLTEAATIKHKGHAPTYFQFDPAPLHMTKEIAPLEICGRRTLPSVDLTVYDFGGLSVSHSIPFAGAFEELIGFSCALAETDLFQRDSRRHVDDLLAVIASAVERASVAAPSEDYLIFQVDEVEGAADVADLWTRHGATTARLLRSERDALSEQEIADAMSTRVSFGREDVAIVDWSAALLVDREPDDVHSVLEFANLQLLEVRFLDAALDRALDHSYEVVSKPRRFGALGPSGWSRRDLARIGGFEVEGAILFERVGNAIKLVGDQYLARVYRAASQRFRLAEWNAGILRKLETIESLYRKVSDRASGARAEALEWIIILLIAIEVVFALVPGLRPG